MEYLFDRDKPHFEVWRSVYDIDTKPASGGSGWAIFFMFSRSRKHAAAPLYYAALCGFYELVENLIIKYPQDVNTDGGYCVRPIVAALEGKHFRTADLLHHNGADPHSRGIRMRTPLHSAAYFGNLEVVQKLIEYGADISAEDQNGHTPLYDGSEGYHPKDCSVLRFLLERGADVNARTKQGETPLLRASIYGALEVVRVLLEHGADVTAKDDRGRTALQVAPNDEIRKLLELKAK
jgi:ankyrin repeat protein